MSHTGLIRPAVEQVFPGIYRMELPLPWELETVNVYLVRLEEGFLLVDSGIGTADCFEAMRSGLDGLGVGFRDVRQIFLTHFHPDHAGLAARIQKLSGASLWMHSKEMEALRVIGEPEKASAAGDAALNAAGVPPELHLRIRKVLAEIRVDARELLANRFVSGGESIPTALGSLEVISTPGHSPGHVCLYQRERQIFFSGDHILPEITPNISWLEDEDPLSDYLSSLRRVGELEMQLVLPAHGQPFRGHRGWTQRTIGHHEERCARIRELLGGQSSTAHELALAMWRRELAPLHHFFAVMEVLAHLEYMRRRGEVSLSRAGGGCLRWTAGPSRLDP